MFWLGNAPILPAPIRDAIYCFIHPSTTNFFPHLISNHLDCPSTPIPHTQTKPWVMSRPRNSTKPASMTSPARSRPRSKRWTCRSRDRARSWLTCTELLLFLPSPLPNYVLCNDPSCKRHADWLSCQHSLRCMSFRLRRHDEFGTQNFSYSRRGKN